MSNYVPSELDIVLDRPIAYQRVFARIGGSPNAGLFMSQAWYWALRATPDNDYWFYKTAADWEDETLLTDKQQETVRQQWKALGVLEEAHRAWPTPATLWFRVNFARMRELIRKLHSLNTLRLPKEVGKLNPQNGEIESAKWGNSYTKNTTKNTKDNHCSLNSLTHNDTRTRDEDFDAAFEAAFNEGPNNDSALTASNHPTLDSKPGSLQPAPAPIREGKEAEIATQPLLGGLKPRVGIGKGRKTRLAARQQPKTKADRVYQDRISDEVFNMVARICYKATTPALLKALTTNQEGRIAGLLIQMRSAGLDVNQTRLEGFELWWKSDWRSKDKHSNKYQCPRPDQIREHWGVAMDWYGVGQDNSNLDPHEVEDEEGRNNIRQLISKRRLNR